MFSLRHRGSHSRGPTMSNSCPFGIFLTTSFIFRDIIISLFFSLPVPLPLFHTVWRMLHLPYTGTFFVLGLHTPSFYLTPFKISTGGGPNCRKIFICNSPPPSPAYLLSSATSYSLLTSAKIITEKWNLHDCHYLEFKELRITRNSREQLCN